LGKKRVKTCNKKQNAKGKMQRAKCKRQKAMGNKQWAKSKGQKAMGKKQRAISKREFTSFGSNGKCASANHKY
jgi:hypothetical protein